MFNWFITISLSILALGCGDGGKKENVPFSLQFPSGKKSASVASTVEVGLNSTRELTVDSVVYFLNGARNIRTETLAPISLTLTDIPLGKRELLAKIYADDETYELTETITILASEKPKLYTYTILETYPHDQDAYTQGLEFENDTLYESTGKRGQSSLRKTDFRTGEVLQKVSLEKQYFAEGLTILNDKIYQLTWQSNTGFIYNLKTMDRTGSFVYGKSKEGWGLCNDGTRIYKSDGTERIYILDPETLAEKGSIEIYTNTSRIPNVNELEWVEGKIYANVYQQSSIAIVNPKNGAVEGVIDLTDLKDQVTQHPELDVLNGIAYKGEKDILYITGKNWDKLFKIQVVEK
jgi:glutamine cyclotransferase